MRYLVIVAWSMLLSVVSCTNKWDENGSLDGLWRYDSIAYHTAMDDSMVYLVGGQRYLAIQLGLVSFRDNALTVVNGHTNETLSRFVYRGDSLIFAPMYIHFRAKDSLLTESSTMANMHFGIQGHEGHFKIEHLTAKRLVLRSEYARLYLVKF